MNSIITYVGVFVILLILELVYFKVADYNNIIDKPNERSSHSTIVLRGGGIILSFSIIVWMGLQLISGQWAVVSDYLPFIIGLVLIAGVSFWDDIHSLPDSVRLVVQFLSMLLMFWSIFGGQNSWFMILEWYWQVLMVVTALIVCVGATNIINFMDGVNGITAGYSLAVLIPLIVKNKELRMENGVGFIDDSFLIVVIVGVLVFCFFNFRPRGKAKCFAGDVGSIGIAFIMLFSIGKLIMTTGDITYLIFLLVYGVDGCLTIIHRIMLHENLGEAHRKHAFQLMANELRMSHVTVSLIYMGLQMIVSLGFIYLCPDLVLAHWIYLIGSGLVLAVVYVLFMKKYYHLHEEYLMNLRMKN